MPTWSWTCPDICPDILDNVCPDKRYAPTSGMPRHATVPDRCRAWWQATLPLTHPTALNSYLTAVKSVTVSPTGPGQCLMRENPDRPDSQGSNFGAWIRNRDVSEPGCLQHPSTRPIRNSSCCGPCTPQEPVLSRLSCQTLAAPVAPLQDPRRRTLPLSSIPAAPPPLLQPIHSTLALIRSPTR